MFQILYQLFENPPATTTRTRAYRPLPPLFTMSHGREAEGDEENPIGLKPLRHVSDPLPVV
jgi:hypothetical protein